jgi:hypothetical protein
MKTQRLTFSLPSRHFPMIPAEIDMFMLQVFRFRFVHQAVWKHIMARLLSLFGLRSRQIRASYHATSQIDSFVIAVNDSAAILQGNTRVFQVGLPFSQWPGRRYGSFC